MKYTPSVPLSEVLLVLFTHWVQRRMVKVIIFPYFFNYIFLIILICFVVARSDLVHCGGST